MNIAVSMGSAAYNKAINFASTMPDTLIRASYFGS